MKKIMLLAACLFAVSAAFSQAKKPTLMIVPSLTWCNDNGFVKQFESQGEVETVADYDAAFLNSNELGSVITQLNNMMQERGFPCKSLKQTLASLKTSSAEEMMLMSSTGAELSETPYDRIKKQAKSDIIIEVSWNVNHTGPRRSVTFTLEGFDAYTNKQIAGATGTGQPSMTSELALLLQEAVQMHIDDFNNHLMTYFTDMAEKGREVALTVRVWDDSPVNLESEMENGDMLMDAIEDWVSENTVSGVYNLVDATENMMNFDQVRIPLNDENGRAVDTRYWARGLYRYLRSMDIDCKLTMRGLGMAGIIIGGK